MDQEEANKQVVEPLQKASEEVKKLSEKRRIHEEIVRKLDETSNEIQKHDAVLKEIEWQYEVRL
jgi:hypothetical protein